MPLSQTETKQLVRLLRKLPAGPDLPLEVFFEFARLQCVAALELVPLRRHEGKTEVLLFRRSASDPFFPSQLHTPGTIVRIPDQTLDETLSRLLAHELPDVSLAGEIEYVMPLLHHSRRGAECSVIFYAPIADDAGEGEWYSVEDLPLDIVPTQPKFILNAAALYGDRVMGKKSPESNTITV